jgi:hypothetical protein
MCLINTLQKKMKTKVLALAAIIGLTSLVSTVSAQERIYALFKKCETMENVDMNVIREKNSEGKLAPSIITIRIRDNEALVNEFLAAFKAEEPNMTSIIENKRAGKLVPTMVKFEDITFSFNLSDKANATVNQMMDRGGMKYMTRDDAKSAVARPPVSPAVPKATPQAPPEEPEP